MKKLSHSLGAKEIEGMKRGFQNNNQTEATLENLNLGFKNETTARRALKLRSPKEWGARIQVSQQKVNRWANGERIPERRQMQIIKEAKFFLLDQRELEAAIDRMLLDQYGPGDKGNF